MNSNQADPKAREQFVEYMMMVTAPLREVDPRMNESEALEDPQNRQLRLEQDFRNQMDVLMDYCQTAHAAFQESEAKEALDRWTVLSHEALDSNDFVTLIQGTPDDVYESLQAVAYQRFEEKNDSVAEAMYAFLSFMRPGDFKNQIMILTILWRKRGIREAADIYESLAPLIDIPGFLFFAADCLYNAGRKDKAISSLERAKVLMTEMEEEYGELDITATQLRGDIENYLDALTR